MTQGFELTEEESALVRNSDWIHTKHRIIAKVYQLFGTMSEKYQALLITQNFLPQEVLKISPKIYKGERYRDLPYVMLDYPRFFSRDDVFAIRSFFWWGNHFSIHLVLGGKYRSQFEQKISDAMRSGQLDGWHIGIAEDPWQHHFENVNYVKIGSGANLPNGNYLKLATMLDFSKWNDSSNFFIESYKNIINIIYDNQ